MAQQNVCDFYKYGFCKFKANCMKQHVAEKCTNSNCEIKSCILRHPRVCRYKRDIGYCKFGEWCLFNHEGLFNGASEVEEISMKIKNIEKLIEEKSIVIESMEKAIKETQERNKAESLQTLANDMQKKFEKFESNLETMKKCLMEKDLFISDLERKISDMDSNFETQNIKIQNLEKANQENVKELSKLKENPTDEKSVEVVTKEKFKCDKCDFECNSKHGLKVHISRKHTQLVKEKFPKKCELCEKTFVNHAEIKRHMKSHSYKEAKFKCEDCDFVGEKFETMEVHMGKCHTDNFECGLCEKNFGSIETLETHLNTCEIYRCRRCFQKENSISKIKSHAERKHPGLQATLIFHLKINRNNRNEVSSSEHWHTKL